MCGLASFLWDTWNLPTLRMVNAFSLYMSKTWSFLNLNWFRVTSKVSFLSDNKPQVLSVLNVYNEKTLNLRNQSTDQGYLRVSQNDLYQKYFFAWTHGRILGVYAEVQQVCIKDGSFSSFIHVERKMNFVCDQENISGIIDIFFSIKIWWKAFK